MAQLIRCKPDSDSHLAVPSPLHSAPWMILRRRSQEKNSFAFIELWGAMGREVHEPGEVSGLIWNVDDQ